MSQKETILLDEIKNQEEREILFLLKRKEKCIYGNIIKELKLPYSKGQTLIFSLFSKGYIKYIDKTSFIELSIELI